MLDALAKAFQDGGEFMYFITLTAGFALAVILDRIWFLLVLYRADNDQIMAILTDSLRKRQVNPQYIEELNKWIRSPIARLVRPVISRADRPNRTLRDRLFEAYLAVAPEVSVRTNMLNVLANVSTLLGLLGTILGLIQAFEGVAAADPAHKQAMLASGIAVAMNTTAYGLMVAIPCIISHAILGNRVRSILNDLERVRQRAFALLERRRETRPV